MALAVSTGMWKHKPSPGLYSMVKESVLGNEVRFLYLDQDLEPEASVQWVSLMN